MPETGVTLDAGVRAYGSATGAEVLDGGYLDVFGFVRWANELVAYRRSAIGYVTPFTIGSARVAGLEPTHGRVEALWPITARGAST